VGEPERVADGIRAGEFDGHLGLFQEAMRERVLSQATSMRWKLTHPLVTVTEDDLTLGEAEMVERVTGQSWAQIDPYTSARECRAILSVCLQSRTDLDGAEAAKVAADVTVTEATEMLGTYEVVAPLVEHPGGQDAVTV
jgi:hypothetical protein